jgi:hypothetical protein
MTRTLDFELPLAIRIEYQGGITQDDYDKKARELKEKQAEFVVRIEQHQLGDGEYRATLESLISLASRAAEL